MAKEDAYITKKGELLVRCDNVCMHMGIVGKRSWDAPWIKANDESMDACMKSKLKSDMKYNDSDVKNQRKQINKARLRQ